MNEFMTWNYLGTFAGAVVATAMFTEFTKGVKFIDKLPTRFVSYIVAAIILLASAGFTGVVGISNYALCLLNAVVVALSANGVYDAANNVKPLTKNERKE